MRALTVLVDIDDTITNLGKAWVTWLDKKYGLDVQWQDITEWDIRQFFPSVREQDVYKPLSDPDFWDTVEPRGDAQYYLKRLIDDGHEVYILTSSIYSSVKEKFDRVLFKYFPYIEWQKVIIAYNKQMIRGDVLVDDGVHNLEGGDYEKILMDAPHNQKYDAEAHGMRRVYSWKGAYRAITQIATRK